MYSLILLFLFGLGIGFFSLQNVVKVPLTIANYTLVGIPLYEIVFVSLLVGAMVSWLVGTVDAIASMMALRQKNKELQNAYVTIQRLQNEKQQLENDNARLQDVRQSILPVPVPEESEKDNTTVQKPSFFERLRLAIQPNYKLYS